MPGRATDLSFMDPINVEDAPTRAVQLAAGELALRVAEERRRRVVGLAGMPQLQARPMIGKPGTIYFVKSLQLACCKLVGASCVSRTFQTCVQGSGPAFFLDLDMPSVTDHLYHTASKQSQTIMKQSSVMERLPSNVDCEITGSLHLDIPEGFQGLQAVPSRMIVLCAV